MAMAIWRKDEQMYTDIQDLMRTYLMHDHTPNIEQQLRQQFDEYFKWHVIDYLNNQKRVDVKHRLFLNLRLFDSRRYNLHALWPRIVEAMISMMVVPFYDPDQNQDNDDRI